jgi:hypothetical protein
MEKVLDGVAPAALLAVPALFRPVIPFFLRYSIEQQGTSSPWTKKKHLGVMIHMTTM